MTDLSFSKVREQYEMLPYPPVNPEDDRHRLVRTWLDELPMINHYCFAGRQSFANGFRVLAAGGGTGGGTIFLAEQLRHTDARIVHLDFSGASIEIAKQRAAIRGLNNIDWIHDSLLNLPTLGLAPFDYINSIGVLHHLPDPDAGLRALKSVLKDDGALALMLYGKYGRTGIYQMQELMRAVNVDETSLAGELANARAIMPQLPKTNWFKRCEDLWRGDMNTDADLYDIALHSQDRAYSIEEIFAWLADEHGFTLDFTAVEKGRSAYMPSVALGPNPPPLLAKIERQPLRRQYAIGELLRGNIMTHGFYATRSTQCRAAYGDADMVPFFVHEPLTGPMVAGIFSQAGGKPFLLNHQHVGLSLMVQPGRYAPQIFMHMDGQRSFQEIFDLVRNDPANRKSPPGNQLLFDDFKNNFDILGAIERILLRHKSVILPAPV
ncbi:MAG TPA: class I SAM-dependent methyltransferase [Usitatibacteraceae bacterium]